MTIGIPKAGQVLATDRSGIGEFWQGLVLNVLIVKVKLLPAQPHREEAGQSARLAVDAEARDAPVNAIAPAIVAMSEVDATSEVLVAIRHMRRAPSKRFDSYAYPPATSEPEASSIWLNVDIMPTSSHDERRLDK
jgi:hypothetical protein